MNWLEVRAAIEQALKDVGEKPLTQFGEKKRVFVWELINKFLEHYEPLWSVCPRCETRAWIGSHYRCADCKTHYCEQCIRPHFNGHDKKDETK